MAARIDHRSYKEQGIDLIPTIHEGYEVRAMEKKGIKTVIGEPVSYTHLTLPTNSRV